MQTPEIILSNELFSVSEILWVGTFVFIAWLFLRIQSAEISLRTLAVASEKIDNLSSTPTKLPVYIAVILELVGIVVLLLGLGASFPIPLYPFSIVIWAGVFVMLFWQTMSISSLEQSLVTVDTGMSQE